MNKEGIMKSKIIMILFLVICVAPAALFVYQNSKQPVYYSLDLYYWGVQSAPGTTVSILVLASFAAGFVLSALMMMSMSRRKIRKLNQRIESLVR